MSFPQLDRHRLRIQRLARRKNQYAIQCDGVSPDASPRPLSGQAHAVLEETAARIKSARQSGRPVILAFGAHTIKNGLGPVLIRLMERQWITHLATNGAGIIHDWEFAYQGLSSEDVRAGVARGEFGIWEETGFFINLAIAIGSFEGRGYGESVGALIEREGLEIPDKDRLKDVIRAAGEDWDRIAAAADLLDRIDRFALKPGWMNVPHPFKRFSAQASAFRLGVPFTGHPMFGHDIIYTHPMNHGGAIGRTAGRDFLSFAHSISAMQDGVYLSVGSAVMSPMIFEKAFSMAQNLALQEGAAIDRHFMAVVDLAKGEWNWQKDGEPPMDHPAYYLRYCKTFSRMGGVMRYACADNRDFLLGLVRQLDAS